MMKYLLRHLRWDYTIVLLVAFAMGHTSFKIFGFMILVFVLARLALLRFGLFGNILTAFLLLAATTSTLAAGAWLLDQPLSPGYIISSYAIVILLLTHWFKNNWHPLMPKPSDLWNKDDLIALAVAGIFITLIVSAAGWPLSAGQIGAIVMKGGDNSAHLNLLKMNDINQGYTIGANNKVNAPGVLITYPQGWHYNGAFIKQIVEPIIAVQTPTVRLMAFFYVLCALWFGALIFLMVRLGLYILEKLTKDKPQNPWMNILTGIVCAIVVGYAFMSLFILGFQSQIAASVFLLLEITLLLYARHAETAGIRFSTLLLAGLALAGSAFAWLFLLPVGGILLALACWQTIREEKNLPWPFVLSALPVGAAIAFQPLVQILIKTPPYKDGVINQPGHTDMLSLYLMLAFLAMATLVFIVQYKNRFIRTLYFGCIVAYLFSFLIMAYQLGTVHELRYYYFKSLYTCLALSAPLIGVGVSLLFAYCLRGVNRRQVMILGAITVFASVMLWFNWRSPFLSQLKTEVRGISPAQGQAIADIIDKNPMNANHITSVGSCNRGDDTRAAQLAIALSYHHPEPYTLQYSPFEVLFINKETVFKSIREFILRYDFPLIIIVNDQVIGEDLRKYLAEIPPNLVHFVTVDDTPETEAVHQCPERVRTLTSDEIAAGRL